MMGKLNYWHCFVYRAENVCSACVYSVLYTNTNAFLVKS